MIVAVTGGLRRDGRRVVRGDGAALTGGDVLLSGRHHLLAAGGTYAVLPHRVAQRRTHDRAACGAGLRFRAGGGAAGGMGQLGRQLDAAALAGLGRGAGGLRAGVVAQRLGHHLAALGADLRLGTGGRCGGYMLMAAGQHHGHSQQRRRQADHSFHGMLPFLGGRLSITMHDYSKQDSFLQVISVNFPCTLPAIWSTAKNRCGFMEKDVLY